MFLGYGIQEYRISAVEKIDIPEGFILEPLVQDHNKEPSGNMLLEYRISVVEEFLHPRRHHPGAVCAGSQ